MKCVRIDFWKSEVTNMIYASFDLTLNKSLRCYYAGRNIFYEDSFESMQYWLQKLIDIGKL